MRYELLDELVKRASRPSPNDGGIRHCAIAPLRHCDNEQRFIVDVNDPHPGIEKPLGRVQLLFAIEREAQGSDLHDRTQGDTPLLDLLLAERRYDIGPPAPGQLAGRPKREEKMPGHVKGNTQLGDDVIRGERRSTSELAKKDALPQIDEALFDFRIHPSRCALELAPLPRNSHAILTA